MGCGGDYRTKSVWSSIVNVLARNKQLCARMPKFKDNRKSKSTPIFNGWTDEREPRSPLSELFEKVVPLLQDLRKKRGAILFPPPPPYPELATPPAKCRVGTVLPPNQQYTTCRPKVSDFACASRPLTAVPSSLISRLVPSSSFPPLVWSAHKPHSSEGSLR